MNSKPNQSRNPADIWQDFIATEQKSNSKLGKLFASASYGGYDNSVLTLFFADEANCKAAKGQIQPLKDKLKSRLLLCDRIDFRIGTAAPPPSPSNQKSDAKPPKTPRNMGNPLQALNFAEFGRDKQGKPLAQPVLEAAANAEKDCSYLYEKLNQRTLDLAGGESNTFKISFSWRMRVGGTRGFAELLLPALHPVFGIPYIPASSLKGAALAWAERHHSNKGEIQELLGMLEGKTAKAAKIEFLDAFPTKPCLSVDVATPQWHWENPEQKVIYNPEPHSLLTLEQPQFLIGFCPTGTQYADQVEVVKKWLENALKTGGIGSRVSGGYGRTVSQEAQLGQSKSFDFELWTQGMYGSNPPTKDNKYQGNPEFRPTAIRGILRYWFRAVALGLYDAATCVTLEELLFGKLGQQGKISVSTRINLSQRKDPYLYTGKIILEATEAKYLSLIERCLVLGSHLGGVGRGSRRPLHLLNNRMRGCYWLVDGDSLPLVGNDQQWRTFFKSVTDAFKAVEPSTKNYTSSPGQPGTKKRQQDVLDSNAQVWLLKDTVLLNPEKVKNWQNEGDSANVKGAALNLLYGDTRFKGVSGGSGNANVGGELGTPSFVWIKSIFPIADSPYQVVTIFGSNHPDRLKFATELKNQGAILVYGQMSSTSQPAPSNSPKPSPRRR
jgi:CRISPR-associated protein Cmr6